jgi:hypothetical protein
MCDVSSLLVEVCKLTGFPSQVGKLDKMKLKEMAKLPA